MADKVPSDLVAEYIAARTARDNADIVLDEIQGRLMKQMEADQRKSYRWEIDGVAHTLTYVRSHTTVIDEKGLRRALRARVFDRYTVRKLDRKAMEAAMDSGEVDRTVVAQFVTLRPNMEHLAYKVRPASVDDA